MPGEMAKEQQPDTVVSGSYIELQKIPAHEDEGPKRSDYRNMKNMNTLYRLYGNAWTIAREECLSIGKDLCQLKHLCTKSNQHSFSRFLEKVSDEEGKSKLSGWLPTLDMCNGFVSASSFGTDCKLSWAAGKKKQHTTARVWSVGDAHPLACCDRAGQNDFRAVPWTQAHTEHVVDKFADIPSLKRAGARNVLRIIINHSVAGFFAAVSWVLSQLLLAKQYGLEPWVDWGPCVLNGWTKGGNNFRYFDAAVGGNAFPPFFGLKNTGAYVTEQGTEGGLNVLTLSSTQVWHVRTNKNFSCSQYDEYCGPYSEHIAAYYAGERAHAWEAMKQFEVNKRIRDEADAYWAKHAPGATVSNVLSVHVRGTDKDPSIGGYKVTPEKYYPFMDAFLAQHPKGKIFIATDSPVYLKEIEAKYGDKVRAAALNVFTQDLPLLLFSLLPAASRVCAPRRCSITTEPMISGPRAIRFWTRPRRPRTTRRARRSSSTRSFSRRATRCLAPALLWLNSPCTSIHGSQATRSICSSRSRPGSPRSSRFSGTRRCC